MAKATHARRPGRIYEGFTNEHLAVINIALCQLADDDPLATGGRRSEEMAESVRRVEGEGVTELDEGLSEGAWTRLVAEWLEEQAELVIRELERGAAGAREGGR